MNRLDNSDLQDILDQDVALYNRVEFIDNDPICVPHRFTKKQDVEIAAFMTAIFAWGQRKTIISKASLFMELMDDSPHDFVLNHKESDLKRFLDFKHRTFNGIDALHFIRFFQFHYQKQASLEVAFTQFMQPSDIDVKNALIGFKDYFFSLPDSPKRTQKHVASPRSNSTCKRLNMFLRWMVRKDDQGVDFGIWDSIQTVQLLIPFDVHVERVALEYGLIDSIKANFKLVQSLTNRLKDFDTNDPVKYDFALFGKGVASKYSL